jgi:ATP-dependent DNA helicase RecG
MNDPDLAKPQHGVIRDMLYTKSVNPVDLMAL